MLKTGITGGIGSGKTSVSNLFRNLGYTVIDADIIGHLCLTHDDVRKKLKNAFGIGIFTKNEVDRKKLGKLVFSSKTELEKLNGIMIPEMVYEIKKEFELLESQNCKIAFVEAAILFEMELDKILDKVLLVTADEKIRITRIKSRDGKKEEEIEKIIKNQSNEFANRKIDCIIENNSTLDDLKTKCEEVLKYLQLFS